MSAAMSAIADRLTEKGLSLVLDGTEGVLKKILPAQADRLVEDIFDIAREITGEGTTRGVEEALNADPGMLLQVKLRALDLAATEKIAHLENDLEVARITAADRSSARQRQISMGDHVPAGLGAFVVFGFFAALFTMMFMDLPADSRAVLNIMVGSLGTMTASVMGYYFGSSAGAKTKGLLVGRHKY